MSLITAQFVKPSVKQGRLHSMPKQLWAVDRQNMRFVPIKTDDQLSSDSVVGPFKILYLGWLARAGVAIRGPPCFRKPTPTGVVEGKRKRVKNVCFEKLPARCSESCL